MYIVLAIIIFGILIGSHELGHFTAAKLCGVKVREFAIGMGPKLLQKQGKETLYTWRLLPIGGFCAMEGEDEDTGDPRAFTRQAVWKRLIILVAGAFMNFLIGLVLIFAVFSAAASFSTPTVTDFMDGCPYVGEDAFLPGDTIYKINNERTYFSSNVGTFLQRFGDENMDVTVIRDGKKVVLKDMHLVPAVEVQNEDGTTSLKYGFYFGVKESGLGAQFKYTWYTALDFVRMIRLSLSDLMGGGAKVKDMAGVVGIVSMINDVGQSSPSVGIAFLDIAYLAAFIAINLAVMNMLPIPALDGGRVFFLLLTWVIEKIIRKKLDPMYEGYIHAVGLVLLIGLMLVVMYNDIVRLFVG